MMDGIQGDDPIESKAVKFKELGGPGAYPLIITAFGGEDNEVLSDAGWRGRYVLFSLVDGHVHKSFTDPRPHKEVPTQNQLAQFCLKVKRGWESHGKEGINWTELEHGGVYDPTDFDAEL